MREKPHLIITTGTSQGICAALTRALLKPGNRLICVSRSRNPDAETTPAASGRLGTGLLLGRIRADAVVFVFFVAGAARILLLYFTRDYRGYVIPVLLLTASALTLTFERYRRSRLSDWAAPPSFGGA